MPAASLSRWTLAYFGSALLCLLVADGLFASGLVRPELYQGGGFLASVHLLAIGWLSQLMIGALLQFVPVLVSRPLFAPRLALPAMLLLWTGLSGLCLSFLALDGVLDLPLGLFGLSGFLLTGGFVLAAIMVGGTLLLARPLALPGKFVGLGLAALVATVMLGLSFAISLGDLSENQYLLRLLSGAAALHGNIGLFGWLTLTAIGVSYRLLSMFMLSPEKARGAGVPSLFLAWATLLCLGACVVGIALSSNWVALLLGLALVCGLGTTILYLADVRALYTTRRRKAVDLGMKAGAAGYVCLGVSAAIIAAAAAGDFPLPLTLASAYLFVFGWLTGLGLAKLYKIIPFLTWLECFGPVLGKMDTPRVQDLISEDRAKVWFVLHYVAVCLASTGLLASVDLIFRAGAIGVFIAACGLTREYYRIRRLAYIMSSGRPTGPAVLPRLCIASRS